MLLCKVCGYKGPEEEFSKSRPTKCKPCRREYERLRYQANPEKRKLANNAWRTSQKLKLWDIKSCTPCADCGNNFHPVAMQFDHLHDKEFDIGLAVNHYSWKRIEKEMEKCELVCANCHAVRSYDRQTRVV